MLTNPLVIWLVVGVIFLVADKFINRFNLLYAAYAAFTIAAFLMIGIMRMPDPDIMPYYHYFVVAQIICFIITIFAWKFIFRDTTQKSNLSTEEKEFYKSIVDKTVEVGVNGINSVSGGEVIFAGKTLKAKLAKDIDSDSVEAGAKMLVREVDGDTLIVVAK